MTSAPPLDPRQPDEIAADLMRRLPVFAPELEDWQTGIRRALVEIYARHLHAIAERLNQAPDKNHLALLDMLGIDVLPAQAARAPVVFSSRPGGGDATAPAGTRVAAEVPGRPDPVVFETEAAIRLAAARLAEVFTVWPGRDTFGDHSAAVTGGRRFELFGEQRPVAHELYLAHDLKLALAGKATIELGVDVVVPGVQPLALAWEYWDGEGWRELAVEDDGTQGLSRRGTIALAADCAAAQRLELRGHTSHWLRARVAAPLVAEPGARLPEIDRIDLATTVNRPNPPGGCADDFLPEHAFTGGQPLDMTKAFQPLGPAPGPGAALYLSCEEAFSKPQAQVRVCIKRSETAQEKADQIADDHGVDVDKARQELQTLRTNAGFLRDALEALVRAGTGPLRADPETQILNATEQAAADSGLVEAMGAVALVQQIFDLFQAGADGRIEVARTGRVGLGLGRAIQFLTQSPVLGPPLVMLQDAIVRLESGIPLPNEPGDVRAAWIPVANTIAGLQPNALRTGTSLLASAQARFTSRIIRIDQARAAVESAITAATDIVGRLNKLDLTEVAAILLDNRGGLSDPVVAWEWWDGSRWRALPSLGGSAGARTLSADGDVTFTVPDGWEQSEESGELGRWLRLRVTAGDYARLRLVSWTNQEGFTNFMPVVEPRPPALKSLTLGYTWASPAEPAEVCLTRNDFHWADRTEAAAWPGDTFTPFTPTRDVAPTLYLGFDREPPVGTLGLFIGVEELVGVDGPTVRWEWWDGSDWRPVSVEDETAGLTRPGMARATWPGGASEERFTVTLAAGRQVRLLDPRHALRFTPGEELWLAGPEGGELVAVDGVREGVLDLGAQIAGAYASATIGRPSLARFGTPRHWLRARLPADAEPRRTPIDALYVNSTWARQVQTVQNELLGSGTGEPGQVLFLTRTPVLAGEELEVRELSGARAEVEEPMLREDVARQGLAGDAVRVERDRDGRVDAVWVQWRSRDNLYFSGPDARDYVVDRSRGRVICGGGGHGRPFPPGRDNVRARRYRSGGGVDGNFEAGAITMVLSGAVAHEVSNPLRADGGSDPEPIAAVQRRGPLVLRHRRQALSRADYEALAREASPAVAFARAVPVADAAARFAPGRVRLTVVPFGAEDQPRPASELRRQVRTFVTARMPATVHGLEVVEPSYLPVSIEAVVVPRRDVEAGAAADAAAREARAFLHPVTGGPEGAGWAFGRDVHRSDVAAALGRLSEIDRLEDLVLVIDGAPVGDRVEVPVDRLVAPAAPRIRISANAQG